MNQSPLFTFVFRFTFIIMIGVGCVPLYISVQQYNKTRLLIENGITTKAVVIDLGKEYVKLPRDNGYGYVYQPILEYSDLENNKRTFVRNTTAPSSLSQYQLGDTMDIVYYAEEPHEERENSFKGLYFVPSTFFFIGIIFINIGLWGLIYLWRK